MQGMIHRLKVLLLVLSCFGLAHCSYLPWTQEDKVATPQTETQTVEKAEKPKPAPQVQKPKPPPEKADTQIIVDLNRQTLFLFKKNQLLKHYPISSSKFGVGNQQDSNQTPLGHHFIAHKIGSGVPVNTIFKSRLNTQKVALIDNEEEVDVITSRIMWLKGLDKGLNKGPGIDSYERYIYIHGTADEANIGQPASFGCIRMKNADVVELFDIVKSGRYGTQVNIVKKIEDLKKPPLTGT